MTIDKKMDAGKRQNEANRRKKLGEKVGETIAETVLAENGFENIFNLNSFIDKFPFADIFAEKDGKRYIISVKTRNKYKKSGSENKSYNLLDKCYKKARTLEKICFAEACWMVIPMDGDKKTYSLYFGSVWELPKRNGKRLESVPIPKCVAGVMGQCFVRDEEFPADLTEDIIKCLAREEQ